MSVEILLHLSDRIERTENDNDTSAVADSVVALISPQTPECCTSLGGTTPRRHELRDQIRDCAGPIQLRGTAVPYRNNSVAGSAVPIEVPAFFLSITPDLLDRRYGI